MGVVIRTYAGVKVLAANYDEDEETLTDPVTGKVITIPYVRVRVYEPYVQQASGLAPNSVLSYTGAGKVLDSSCSSYVAWRDELQRRVIGLIPEDPTAFKELINFSDQEGVIGTACCAKLAGDFNKYSNRLHSPGLVWFNSNYEAMRDGFSFAARNGIVNFT